MVHACQDDRRRPAAERRADGAGAQVRMLRVGWYGAMLAIVLPVSESAATAALAAQLAAVPAPESASVLDRPAGAARPRDPRGPAPATLAALRERWPVRGPLNSTFGLRGRFWRKRFHAGVDIGARPGTPVKAPAPGVVVFAGWRRGYGRTIIIDHGRRVRSVYAHLSGFDVKARQRVAAGTRIGRTGTTGHSSGPHLHYEVLINGRPVNPRS